LESERLVVKIPKRQKDWLRAQAAEFKTVSDVIRELLDREMNKSA
jgi:Arc/MetJ-type ribon-helix-helix transcriptional regulator